MIKIKKYLLNSLESQAISNNNLHHFNKQATFFHYFKILDRLKTINSLNSASSRTENLT